MYNIHHVTGESGQFQENKLDFHTIFREGKSPLHIGSSGLPESILIIYCNNS